MRATSNDKLYELLTLSMAETVDEKMTRKSRNAIIRQIVFTWTMMQRRYYIGKHYLRMDKLTLVLAWLVLITVSSCVRKDVITPMELPATSVLTAQSTWAVITSSHLRLRETPSTESKALTTLWQGSVLEIVSRTSTKDTADDQIDYWYQINYDGLHGWVFGTYIVAFESRDNAEIEAGKLKK